MLTYIYLIEKYLCDCRNVSIKLLCVCDFHFFDFLVKVSSLYSYTHTHTHPHSHTHTNAHTHAHTYIHVLVCVLAGLMNVGLCVQVEVGRKANHLTRYSGMKSVHITKKMGY